MSAEPSVAPSEVKTSSEPDVPFVKKRAPTLYVIIAIKLLKGVPCLPTGNDCSGTTSIVPERRRAPLKFEISNLKSAGILAS